MRFSYIFVLFYILISTFTTVAQIVVLDPITAGPEDPVTIIFDANQGNKELVELQKYTSIMES
jgi:hypothetical protein